MLSMAVEAMNAEIDTPGGGASMGKVITLDQLEDVPKEAYAWERKAEDEAMPANEDDEDEGPTHTQATSHEDPVRKAP
jgi:hypothetical protein